MDSEKFNETVTLATQGYESKIEVTIEPGEVISQISSNGITKKIPTNVYVYPANSNETQSGLYIFNPLYPASKINLTILKWVIQKGILITRMDTLYDAGNFLFSFKIQINNATCPNASMQIDTSLKVYSD